MFGLRRRHRKVQPEPAVLPDAGRDGSVALTEEQIFTIVHERLEAFIGVGGTWSLVRRDPKNAGDDGIFSSMSTIMLARDIASDVLGSPAAAVPAGAPVSVDDVPVQSEDAPDARASQGTDRALREMLRPVPRDDDESQVSLELTTIAQWADPAHHDPDHVSTKLVSPATTERESRGA